MLQSWVLGRPTLVSSIWVLTATTTLCSAGAADELVDMQAGHHMIMQGINRGLCRIHHVVLNQMLAHTQPKREKRWHFLLATWPRLHLWLR